MDKPSVDGLFENLWQVFSLGEDGQQMLAEFYSRVQNPKESVKEFRESILQIARKIMTAKPEFKVDIDNTLKARFANGLRDHYHQAMAREMIHTCPMLSYVAYKLEVLIILGPNVKPHSITTSKLETSDTESPPKKCKCESEPDQKINAAIEENRKLSECLSAFNPKTITDMVINTVQGNYPSSKPALRYIKNWITQNLPLNQVIQCKIWTCYVKKYRAKHSVTLIKSTSCNKWLPCVQKS